MYFPSEFPVCQNRRHGCRTDTMVRPHHIAFCQITVASAFIFFAARLWLRLRPLRATCSNFFHCIWYALLEVNKFVFFFHFLPSLTGWPVGRVDRVIEPIVPWFIPPFRHQNAFRKADWSAMTFHNEFSKIKSTIENVASMSECLVWSVLGLGGSRWCRVTVTNSRFII